MHRSAIFLSDGRAGTFLVLTAFVFS
jgi:hypothetical protein